MKKESKFRVAVKVILTLIFVVTLLFSIFYCTLILPTKIKNASFQLYSFNEIQRKKSKKF